MMKKCIALIVGCILLHFTAVSAQLVLLEGIGQRDVQRLKTINTQLVGITNTDWLVINPEKSDIAPILHTTLDTWDNSAFYFILYPIRQSSLDAIAEYGTILHKTDAYVIFKSFIEILNDYEPFHSFEIARIFPYSSTTDESSIQGSNHKSSSSAFKQDIKDLIEKVSGDSIWKQIGLMEKMERYTTAAEAIDAAHYLKDYLSQFPFDSLYLHTYQSGKSPNVIAIKKGKENPEEIYILGGHYDTYKKNAPGADDNASGTAGTIEAARVLAPNDFNKTLIFICFSGEEMGFLGSGAYASEAKKNNQKILGMINFDVMSYVKPGDPEDIDIGYDDQSKNMFDFYCKTLKTYLPDVAYWDSYNTTIKNYSDNKSFWDNGFQALITNGAIDSKHNAYSPYMHTSNDILGKSANNKKIAELVTKGAVAYLAASAELISNTEIDGNTTQHTAKNAFKVITNKHGNLTFLISDNVSQGNVSIYNLQGKRLFTKKVLHGHRIHCSTDLFSNGLYYMIFISDNGMHYQKSIIIK